VWCGCDFVSDLVEAAMSLRVLIARAPRPFSLRDAGRKGEG